LERAYRHAGIEGLEFQSTLELVLSVGAKPGIVTGEKRNVKITTPADLEYAHFLITQKRYDHE